MWSDSFAEKGNLAVHIYALRRVLGEKRGEKKFIETVSGRGYSFVFPAEEVASNSKTAPKPADIDKSVSTNDLSTDLTELRRIPDRFAI